MNIAQVYSDTIKFDMISCPQGDSFRLSLIMCVNEQDICVTGNVHYPINVFYLTR